MKYFPKWEIKKSSIKIEDNILNLVFYISNIKYPSISFNLKEISKTYKDIIKENEVLKEENNTLKDRLKKNEEYIKNLESTIKSFGNDIEINIFILYNNCYGGREIKNYSFKMKDTIDYLIDTVNKKENIIGNPSVYFRNIELTYESENNLAYYGIYENSTIRFHVSYLGGEYEIYCHHPVFIKKLELTNETIEDIKKKIIESEKDFFSEFGITHKELVLEYYGKKLEDFRSFYDYNIPRGRRIDLYVKYY